MLVKGVLDVGELLRTNDPGLISAFEGLLQAAEIPFFTSDRSMSVIEGSISAIQVRILVADDRLAEARELITDAELGQWLTP